MYANRHRFTLAILRLGIVYGPSPVEHTRPESQTVVDKFRRLAADDQPLPVENGGTATIGTVHVEDAARILLGSPWQEGIATANVAAETVTVADVAALARGEPPRGGAASMFASPFSYRYRLADYFSR
jgi:nucleoside-diphosphate-sugar epimerase